MWIAFHRMRSITVMMPFLAGAVLLLCVSLSLTISAENVRPQRAPISLGVLVDAGGKMEPLVEMTKAGFDGLMQTLQPDDEVFLMAFGRTVAEISDFSTDKAAVSRAFARFQARGDSSLYQTLDAATKKLQEKGKNERKLLIVITAGQITPSDYGRVMDLIDKSKVLVHTVGAIVNCGPCEVQPKEIARKSGGIYAGISRVSTDRYTIVPAFRTIAEHIAKY